MDITDRLLTFLMSYYRAGSKFGIYHWLTCRGVDGRTDGHVITKISRIFWLPFLLTHGAPLRELRYYCSYVWKKALSRLMISVLSGIIGSFIRGKITPSYIRQVLNHRGKLSRINGTFCSIRSVLAKFSGPGCSFYEFYEWYIFQ